MGVWFIVIPEGTADEFACCKKCNLPFVSLSETNLEMILYVLCCDIVNVKHRPSLHIKGSTGEYERIISVTLPASDATLKLDGSMSMHEILQRSTYRIHLFC